MRTRPAAAVGGGEVKGLLALPEDWAIAREADGWMVADLSGDCYDCGSSYRWLGSGKTVAAAIKAAHATVAREEQEAEARRIERLRQESNGELSGIRRSMSLIPEIWADEIIKRVEASPSAMALLSSPVVLEPAK